MASPEPIAPPPAPASAVVTLEMDSWCRVSTGGKNLGTANPNLTFQIAPGTHVIDCKREDGRSWSRRLTFAPGERRTERGHILPSVVVSVALSRGDAIRIKPGNKILRSGSGASLPAGRVKVEVLAGGKTIGSDWVTFRPGPPCTVKDTPRIDCY